MTSQLTELRAPAVEPEPRGRVRGRMRGRRRYRAGLGRLDAATLIGPCLLVMLVLLSLPIVQSIIWSFQRADYSGSSGWVGLQNYRDALSDPQFRQAVEFTVVFTIVQTIAVVAVGYVLAALLNRVRVLRSLYMGILLIPFVVPSVLASTSFGWLFDDNFGGVANHVLSWLTGHSYDWFSGTWPNRVLILTDVVWMSAPFAMLVFLAAMKGISSELIEAAELDGVTWAQKHRYVVIPGIRSMITFVSMITLMDGLRLFDPLIPLSRAAAANGNLSVELYVYQHAFARANQNVGLGSAVNVLMIIVMIPLVFPMLRTNKDAD